jgi:hypothetical protein
MAVVTPSNGLIHIAQAGDMIDGFNIGPLWGQGTRIVVVLPNTASIVHNSGVPVPPTSMPIRLRAGANFTAAALSVVEVLYGGGGAGAQFFIQPQ